MQEAQTVSHHPYRGTVVSTTTVPPSKRGSQEDYQMFYLPETVIPVQDTRALSWLIPLAPKRFHGQL